MIESFFFSSLPSAEGEACNLKPPSPRRQRRLTNGLVNNYLGRESNFEGEVGGLYIRGEFYLGSGREPLINRPLGHKESMSAPGGLKEAL